MAIRRLNKITLENFQSHRYTSIEFDSAVTVLAGESSNGKTAVLRALNWVFTNRPIGTGFVSHWAKTVNTRGEQVMRPNCECSVQIDFTDTEGKEHSVRRVRSATDNFYELDGQKYKAVGSDVPEDIRKLLNISDVNVQSQHDPYFLITQTPGQVAGRLNKLVHLDTIDEAYAFLRRCKVEVNVLLKETTSSLASANVLIDSLKHIVQVEQDYQKCKLQLEAVQAYENKLSDLHEMQETLNRCLVAIKEVGVLPDVASLTRLHNLLEVWEECEVEYNELSDSLAQLKDIKLQDKELPTVQYNKDLHKLIEEFDTIQVYLCRLTDIEDSITNLDEFIVDNNIELERVKQQLPETCPLCGGLMEDCKHV